MKESKLTEKVQRVLKALQEGKYAGYNPYMGRFNPHEYYNVNSLHFLKLTSQVIYDISL